MASIVTAIITAFLGVVTGFLTSEWRKREERIKEWDRVRTRYLNPLRTSSRELPDWLDQVVQKLRDPTSERKKQLLDWFQRIKDTAEKRRDRGGFFWECNGELYFALATMYATARHFALANRVRSELPYLEFRDRERHAVSDEELLSRINDVRDAFSGEKGLWDTLQESIGEALTKPDGTLRSYREFCICLVNDDEWVWFLRLIDFYREVGDKAETLEQVSLKLRDLRELVIRMSERRIWF